MSDSGKSWKSALYGESNNNGYLFRGYLRSTVSAIQRKPTRNGISEVMQPILPLLRDDKEKDRVRKYYSSRSPETDPYEIAKYLDEKVIGPLSIEGKELVAFLRDRNAHFHSLIPGSLKKQFINPPAGSWWLPYISAYQSICSVDSDAHDEICLFLLKIVETEIELLREGSSNRLKAVESGLLSPHGEPINSEADEVIDRLGVLEILCQSFYSNEKRMTACQINSTLKKQ